MPAESARVAALLRLTAIPKERWQDCLEQVLLADAELLGVGRVNYWSVRSDPTRLCCEMGYSVGEHAFEHGRELLEAQYPAYFRALDQPVVDIPDALGDPRSAELRQYLQVRGIASMLDIPMRSHGRVIGVLCHEHRGTPRQWTSVDMEIAMAAAQALLVAREAYARDQAEHLQRNAALLDRVSRRLVHLVDVGEVARRALDCIVPELADWSVFDLLEHGALVRVGMAHRTAEGSALLQQMTRHFPPRAGGPHLSARTIELAESVVIPDMGKLDLLGLGISPQHARMLRQLGTHSALCAPLLEGGHVIGALVFGAAEPRDYGQDDLTLCEELAQRLAAAVQNARLHTQAREAIRARDELIALAAHELHGPLASLQLAAESLAARADASSPQAIARMSTTIVAQSRRLNRLVDHMLDAARVMSSRLVIVPERIDLSALVRDLVASMRERLELSGSELRLDVQDAVTGDWDGDRLAQVIQNLLDNAIKFGRGEPIEVALHASDDAVTLSVRDHGIGIPEDRIATIFERFERAVSPRRFGGLGLGLYTSRALVEAHGGTVTVQSAPDQGASFVVRLPLHARP
jgi:signal transduction histidine kinase